MRILLFFLLSALIHEALAVDFVLINKSSDARFSEKLLIQQARRAKELFENQLGPLTETIVISIGESGCLRTGYNFIEKKVVFCKNKIQKIMV